MQYQLDGFFFTLFAVRPGKVAFVYPAYVRGAALQVQAVGRVKLWLCKRQSQLRTVVALKGRTYHGRLGAFRHVLGHCINKEKAQRLDAALEQLFFALKVVGNAAFNDQRLHLFGQHAVRRWLTQRQRKAIGKQQFFACDAFHHMAV